MQANEVSHRPPVLRRTGFSPPVRLQRADARWGRPERAKSRAAFARLTPSVLVLVLFFLLRLTGVAPASEPSAAPGDTLFLANAPLRHLRLFIPDEGMERLRREPRQDFPARLEDGTGVWLDVGVHLKGGGGSWRNLDDRPSLTLSFNRFVPRQQYCGQTKLHLNNSVQDPSFCRELICAEMFRAGGIPAARVTHAEVSLNGRPLGLYVLKEGFTKTFLASHFRRTDGNLYDIGPGQEVNERMHRQLGHGPDEQTDLRALATAALETNAVLRWAGLTNTLDVSRFVSFLALEVMLGHWDGYGMSGNNFRVYHDMDTDRLIFLPHGMDQALKQPLRTLRPELNALVARGVLSTPSGSALYRVRFGTLFTNVFVLPRLSERLDEISAKLRRTHPEIEPNLVALRAQLVSRAECIRSKLASP